MLDINEAYGILNDEDKRKKYDLMGIDGVEGNSSGFDGGNFSGFEGFNGAQGFSGFSNGPGGTRMRFTTTSSDGGIDPNIFNMFFGEGSKNTFNFSNMGSQAGGFGGKKRRKTGGVKDMWSDMGGFGDMGGFSDMDGFGDFGGFGGMEGFGDFRDFGKSSMFRNTFNEEHGKTHKSNGTSSKKR